MSGGGECTSAERPDEAMSHVPGGGDFGTPRGTACDSKLRNGSFLEFSVSYFRAVVYIHIATDVHFNKAGDLATSPSFPSSSSQRYLRANLWLLKAPGSAATVRGFEP